MGAVPSPSQTLSWCVLELSYAATYLYLHMAFPTDIEGLSLFDITLQPLEKLAKGFNIYCVTVTQHILNSQKVINGCYNSVVLRKGTCLRMCSSYLIFTVMALVGLRHQKLKQQNLPSAAL